MSGTENAVVDPAYEMPAAERVVSDACDALLDRFVIRSEPHLRKLSESVYENLLTDVQEYLKSNANWNLANEIERCRRIEAENRELIAQRDGLVRALQGLTNFVGSLRWGQAFPGRPHAEIDAALEAVAKATTPT